MLCSLAWNIQSLIAFRVVQGCGGGMLTPLGMAILSRAAGRDRIGRVMSILGIPMLLGPICGPVLGGRLLGSASRHWIFLINVPVGLLAIAAGTVVLPCGGASARKPFDFLGMVLDAPGLAVLLFGFSSILQMGTVGFAARAGADRDRRRAVDRLCRPRGAGTGPLIDLSLPQSRGVAGGAGHAAVRRAYLGCALLMPTTTCSCGVNRPCAPVCC
ncbi:MFS transporter [Nocardia sp. NPDC059091]|uniref:MFS transporter n=1 Tax=unclassified Nocardia TaxID=2637762 RepID=UPI00369E6717